MAGRQPGSKNHPAELRAEIVEKFDAMKQEFPSRTKASIAEQLSKEYGPPQATILNWYNNGERATAPAAPATAASRPPLDWTAVLAALDGLRAKHADAAAKLTEAKKDLADVETDVEREVAKVRAEGQRDINKAKTVVKRAELRLVDIERQLTEATLGMAAAAQVAVASTNGNGESVEGNET